MLVPAGGLSEDGMEWIEAPGKFFVPVKALSAMFRGILVRLIQEQWENNALKIPDEFPGFATMKRELYEKNRNVYSKKALCGVNGVLAYLGWIKPGGHLKQPDYKRGKQRSNFQV
jgi:hypothetical protein